MELNKQSLKTHLSLLNKKTFEGYCLLYEIFLQLKREQSLFYQMIYIYLYIKVKKTQHDLTLMFNLKFKLLWIYTTNRPSKFSTIIHSERSSMKRFVEWKYIYIYIYIYVYIYPFVPYCRGGQIKCTRGELSRFIKIRWREGILVFRSFSDNS